MQYFACNSFRWNILRGEIFPASLFSIFCTWVGGGGTPSRVAERSVVVPQLDERQTKSFGCNILPVTPFDGIFCEGKIFPASLFSVFCTRGRGVTPLLRSLGISSRPQIG